MKAAPNFRSLGIGSVEGFGALRPVSRTIAVESASHKLGLVPSAVCSQAFQEKGHAAIHSGMFRFSGGHQGDERP